MADSESIPSYEVSDERKERCRELILTNEQLIEEPFLQLISNLRDMYNNILLTDGQEMASAAVLASLVSAVSSLLYALSGNDSVIVAEKILATVQQVTKREQTAHDQGDSKKE